jgi:DNA-binding MarR family transcriptional regulator
MKKTYAVIRVIEEMRKIDKDIPAHTVNIFLTVCMQPGITMKELSERLGIPQSTMSRNVSVLSRYKSFGEPGYDLLETDIDPTERRRKIVNLTHKGRLVQKAIAEILEK